MPLSACPGLTASGTIEGCHDADITPETIIPAWYGERLDLDHAIYICFANAANAANAATDAYAARPGRPGNNGFTPVPAAQPDTGGPVRHRQPGRRRRGGPAPGVGHRTARVDAQPARVIMRVCNRAVNFESRHAVN